VKRIEYSGGRWILLALALASLASEVRAQPSTATTLAAPAVDQPVDTSSVEALLDESIVSIASLTAETAKTAPGTTWSISGDELRQYGITTLADAINFLAMGMVTERYLDASEIGARGVEFAGDYGSHILLLLDGHALNEQWESAISLDRPLGVPLELIDHIELILGPGSVLYGSNAVLGVVNIVTKRAENFGTMRVVLESELVSSLRVGAGGGTSFTLLHTPGHVVGMVEGYAQQGPAVEVGPQEYGVDAVTGLRRRFRADHVNNGVWGGTVYAGRFERMPAGYLRTDWGDLELDLRGVQSNRGSPISVWVDFDSPATRVNERWLSGDLRYHRQATDTLDLSARLYLDDYLYHEHLPTEAAENCLDGQLEGCAYELTGTARWAGLELRGNLDWFGDRKLSTLVGTDGRARIIDNNESYVDNRSGERTTADAWTTQELAIGAYVEQTIGVVDWLGVNFGARLDADQRFGAHLSPRVAVTLTAWQGGALKGIFSEAFRAPHAYEINYADPTWWVIADSLRPEVVRSAELAFEQRLGLHRLVASLFATSWFDLVREQTLTDEELQAAIERGELQADVDTGYQYRNTDSFVSYGANAALLGQVLQGRLRYGVTLTAARIQQDWLSWDQPVALPAAAGLFGNARVSYRFDEPWPTVAAAVRMVGPRQVYGTEFDPPPAAPLQAEARLTASGPLPWVSGLRYRVSVGGALADESAFATGPLRAPSDTYTRQETAPVDRYRLLVGLDYTPDFNNHESRP